MRRLVRAVGGDVQVRGLLGAERGQLDVELGKVRAGNLLVELLREHVDAELELAGVGPESDLGEHLVGERAGHDEGRVASGTAKVHETTLREEDDVAAVGQRVAIDLGLDVDGLHRVLLEPRDIDLNVEVTDATRT